MKVAIYCRVSGDGQDIKKQREELPKFAESQGWEIYDNYVDEGISGASIEARPDFKRLLEDMVHQKFNILLVEVHDRITRTSNHAERGLIMQMLIDNNIMLYSQAEGACDLSGFAGEITSTIKFIIAAEERKNIVRRTVGGKKAKIAKGIPAWGGKLPFARSYNKKTGKWSLDEKKADHIRWAAKEYLKGGSLRDIAKILTTKHRMKISYDNLIRTLKIRCGDTWSIKFKDGETADFKIPRILSNATIKAIQERLKFNKTFNRKDCKKYPLSGFLRCSKCRRPLYGQESSVNPANKKYRYKIYRHPMYEKGEKCKCKAFSSISADKIENAVFTTIFENIHDELHFKRAIKEALPDGRLIKSLKAKIDKGKRSLKKVERNLDKLVESVLKGTLTKETIKKKESELLEGKKAIEDDLKKDENRLATLPDLEKTKKEAERIRLGLLDYFGDVEIFMEDASYKHKREFLHWLFDMPDEEFLFEHGIFIEKIGDMWDYEINAKLIYGTRTIFDNDIDYPRDLSDLESITKSTPSDNCYSTKGL